MRRIKSPYYTTHACLHVQKRTISTNSSINKKTTNTSTTKRKTNEQPTSTEELRIIFEQYANQNNLSPSAWYQLSSASLDEPTKQIISKQFNGNLYLALSTIFPEIEWKAWKFQHFQVPRNFWKEQSNQRQFFDDLGKELGVEKMDDWYSKLSVDAIHKHGGGTLLETKYNSSRSAALMAVYPEHNWMLWKFAGVPDGYWNSLSNQRKFFDWLGKELGVVKMDDWYEKLTKDVINKQGGCGLLNKYNNSPTAALMAVYPEHNWIPWKFNAVPRGYWTDVSNHRKFFDWLGKELGVEKMDDWYEKLSKDSIIKHGGGLLNKYNNSPTAALMAVYPEHNWIPWKFNMTPLGFWNCKADVRQYLNELSEKLSIQALDDWYLVSVELLNQFGARRLLEKYKSLYNILKEQYPHHPWDPNRFKQRGKKAQRWLAVTLKKIFPNEEILEDYMHPKAVFPSSNRPIQLDIYLPSRSLAFEYQGVQHYQDNGIFSPTTNYQQRDEEKRVVCTANNIKLIEVPYWWKRTQEDLQEIIHKSGVSLSV